MFKFTLSTAIKRDTLQLIKSLLNNIPRANSNLSEQKFSCFCVLIGKSAIIERDKDK